MRALTVSVDFTDLLSLVIPYNRHHFEDWLVVASWSDNATASLCEKYGVRVYRTDAFYKDGAVFNKFRAMEEGLDYYGRYGWLVLLDSDVLWPQVLPPIDWEAGNLYTPRRRMLHDVTVLNRESIPPESAWSQYPLHPQAIEWAGYSQIFHASDPVLGDPPWHETNWSHCGGADSFFQYKWPVDRKIRPPFEVLHLGPAGANWCGRASMRIDGTIPEDAMEKQDQVRRFVRSRVRGAADPYAAEKIVRRY
jgi:hypothetical protein